MRKTFDLSETHRQFAARFGHSRSLRMQLAGSWATKRARRYWRCIETHSGPVLRRALGLLPSAALSLCVLLTCLAARAESVPCVLKIAQLEAGEGTPFYVRCPGGPGVCRGKFELSIDGAKRTVFVKALCESGSVILAFADESGTFALGSQTFIKIHIPHSNTAHASLSLYPPLAQLQQDSPTPQFHLPVLRQSDRAVAKIEVDVWTGE